MSTNILGISPYHEPLRQISHGICKAFKSLKEDSKSHIEIEFKYSELKSFCNSYYYESLNKVQMSQEIKSKVMNITDFYVYEQNGLHYQSLKKLSYQSMILLNPLGRIYDLRGDFYEHVHKKFYKIREFFIKLCSQNELKDSAGPFNFYEDIQKIGENRRLKMLNPSELRLDINIKTGENMGRYSFLVNGGWTRTQKKNLIHEDFDIMMAERTFRLAIKQQTEEAISSRDFLQILAQTSEKGVFVRVKRTMNVQKKEDVIFSLSEVYQPTEERRSELIQDIIDLLSLDAESLNEFCINVFQEFYMQESEQSTSNEGVSKYEIQSEFTPAAIAKIYKLYQNKQLKEIECYVYQNLEDIYSLYFADHAIKTREASVLERMKQLTQESAQNNLPECRLENEFGAYMHDLIYNFMTT